MLVDNEIVREDAVEGELGGKALAPLLDLFVLLVFPVEAGSLRPGACVQARLSVKLHVHACPHHAIDESLHSPRTFLLYGVAIC